MQPHATGAGQNGIENTLAAEKHILGAGNRPDIHLDAGAEACQSGRTIVSISKEWMTWGDSYELNITNPSDEIVALAVVLKIDCVMEAAATAASSS